MGFLEAIVVVYLRQIYHPQGFDFPLGAVSPIMLSFEWLREIATIVMLVALAALAATNFLQKFCYFLYSFAVWDIFYYLGLKLLLDWAIFSRARFALAAWMMFHPATLSRIAVKTAGLPRTRSRPSPVHRLIRPIVPSTPARLV